MRKLFSFLINFLSRHTIVSLLIIFTGAAVLLPSLRELKLKPSFQDMLPDSSPAVININKLTRIYGGEGYFLLTIEHGSIEGLSNQHAVFPALRCITEEHSSNNRTNRFLDLQRQFADDLAPRIEKIKEVEFVRYRIDDQFFKRNSLLYLSIDDLNEVGRRAEQKIRYEIMVRSPLLKDSAGKPYVFTVRDIMDKYGVNKIRRYLIDQDDKTLIMLIKPNGSPNDMQFTTSLTESVFKEVSALQEKEKYQELVIDAGGRYYETYLDNRQLMNDISLLTSIAVAVILLILLLYYRRIKPVIIISIPLAFSIYFNFVLARYTIGHLNLLTSWLTGILMGLGLDFGIHVYSRYLDERSTSGPEEALIRTFTHTGTASIAGALTTAAAFYSLLIARFRGFSEFGFIAGNGMVLNILCMCVLFPLIILVFERLSKFSRLFCIQPGSNNPQSNQSEIGVKKNKPPKMLYGRIAFFNPILRLLFIAAVFYSFQTVKNGIGFEYNFQNLKGESRTLDTFNEKIERILGVTVQPTVIMTADYSVMEQLSRRFNPRMNTNIHYTIKSVQSILAYIPDKQDQKLKIIQKYASLFKNHPELVAAANAAAGYDLRLLLNAGQISIHNLPTDMQRDYLTADKKLYFLLVHGNRVIFENLNAYIDFIDELTALQIDGAKYEVAGIAFVMVEIIRLIFNEGPRILAFCGFLLLFTCIFLFRNIKDIFIIFASLLSGILFMLTFMVKMNMTFNILNIIALPLLLGMGIDSSIHIIHRVRENPQQSAAYSMNMVYRVIILSSVTTILGFAALYFAGFVGLKTVGTTAVCGLAATLLSSLVFLPAFLPWLYPASQKRKTETQEDGSGI